MKFTVFLLTAISALPLIIAAPADPAPSAADAGDGYPQHFDNLLTVTLVTDWDEGVVRYDFTDKDKGKTLDKIHFDEASKDNVQVGDNKYQSIGKFYANKKEDKAYKFTVDRNAFVADDYSIVCGVSFLEDPGKEEVFIMMTAKDKIISSDEDQVEVQCVPAKGHELSGDAVAAVEV